MYFSSGCTQPYLENWVEGFPSHPSEGTLSRRPGEPLKISLSAIGDFLVNWVIPGNPSHFQLISIYLTLAILMSSTIRYYAWRPSICGVQARVCVLVPIVHCIANDRGQLRPCIQLKSTAFN